jgi:hypothetical protein
MSFAKLMQFGDSDSVLEKGWEILREKPGASLSLTAKMCFLLLMAERIKEVSGLDFATLAKRLSCSEKQARRCVQDIESRGLLKKLVA